MNPIKLIFVCIFCFLNYNHIIGQNLNLKISDIPSKDVYKIHAALGEDANYYEIQNYMDSLIQNEIINDTDEDKEIARYGKWSWFWNGRTSIDLNNLSKRGDFSTYFKLMNQYSNKSSNCPNNTTNIQYNWNLKGPVQLPIQTMVISVYVVPNPNTGKPTIFYNLGAEKQGELVIIDSYGKIINQIKVTSESKKIDVDYSGYASGVYLISLKNSKGEVTNQKMIIAK